MVWKYRLAKDMLNKLRIFGSNRRILEFRRSVEKDHVWKKSGVTTRAKMEVEVVTLLLRNDKNNVVAENVLSYSLCLSSRFEVQATRFGTKQ